MARGKKSIGALLLALTLGCAIFAPTASADAYTRLFNVQKKIAEKGDPSAQLHLGEMYELGLGTSADNDLAMKWYAKAAEKGNPIATQKMDALRRSIEEEKEDAARANREAEQAKVPPIATAPSSSPAPSIAKAAPADPKPAVVVADDKAIKARREAKAKADEARRRQLVKDILARQHKAAQQDVFE